LLLLWVDVTSNSTTMRFSFLVFFLKKSPTAKATVVAEWGILAMEQKWYVALRPIDSYFTRGIRCLPSAATR
jgi:hypothetical protein